MTPQQLIGFRQRMGWSRDELARRLDLSGSRLSDYELGHTRTIPPRPAPIPRVVELAIRWLETQTPPRPLTPEEKAILWSDVSYVPATAPVDDSREAIYREPRGR